MSAGSAIKVSLKGEICWFISSPMMKLERNKQDLFPMIWFLYWKQKQPYILMIERYTSYKDFRLNTWLIGFLFDFRSLLIQSAIYATKYLINPI